MTEADSAPGLTTTILHTPKTSTELTWVEQAHGVESVMTIIALVIGAGWALFGDWRKSKGEREAERNCAIANANNAKTSYKSRDRSANGIRLRLHGRSTKSF